MKKLLAKISQIETKIMVYSDLADQVRVGELSIELAQLNAQYLDAMMQNDLCDKFESFLDSQKAA